MVDINNLPKINPEDVIFNTLRLNEKLVELKRNFIMNNREVMQEYGIVFIGLDDAYPGLDDMKKIVLEFINIFKDDTEIVLDSDSETESEDNKFVNYVYIDSDSETESEDNYIDIGTDTDTDTDTDSNSDSDSENKIKTESVSD